MRFFKPSLAAEGDLQLVAPSLGLVDEFLAAQPLTSPDLASLWTRPQLVELVRTCPDGIDHGDPIFERWPAYYFWMRRAAGGRQAIVGTLAFRISSHEQIELYYGHIGYSVFPAARGNRYAERATRLIFPLARRHAMERLWITANPDNIASRRTCERLGAELIDTIPVPPTTRLFARGDREKCRYLLSVPTPGTPGER